MEVVSFFSGLGGLDLGFEEAGFEVTEAFDYNSKLKPSYDANFYYRQPLQIVDITKQENQIFSCDGIIGGPPCQPFSLAGSVKRWEDLRSQPLISFLKIIENSQPKLFVLENVAALAKHAPSMELIRNRVADMGYKMTLYSSNAMYHGVPQDRKRVFIIGIRNDIDAILPTEELRGEVTVLEEFWHKGWRRTVGAKASDKFNASNDQYDTQGYSSSYMSRNRVRPFGQPQYTVVASSRHITQHPDVIMEKVSRDEWKFVGQDRRLSIRECLQIQGFPQDFILDFPTVGDAYTAIGNAVPPPLAEHVAYIIKEALDNGK